MQISREEHQRYYQKKIKNVLEKITIELLKDKPEQPIQYMISWLKNYQQTIFEADQEDQKRQQKDSQLIKINFETKIKPYKQNYLSKPRQSISAEVFGVINVRKPYVPEIIPKSQDQKASISQILNKSFVFSSLDQKAKALVIDCMEKRQFTQNQYVIKQGQNGNEIFIVAKGTLSCYKKFNSCQENDIFLKTYQQGDSFGQLSLLYNIPRQASIKANENCILWAMNRENFNNIVRDSMITKKANILEWLKNVNIFSKMKQRQLEKIVDSIKIEHFQQGQYICKEGDQGDKFYIVQKGQLIAEKMIKKQGKVQNVFKYDQGSYFGEIALLCSTTRKASIKALTKCTLLSLSRSQFSRLVGLDQEILNDFSKYRDLQVMKK